MRAWSTAMSCSSKCFGLYMSTHLFRIEVRVLDDVRAHLHVLQPAHGRGGVGDAPISDGALVTGLAVGNEAKLEAAHRVADVERLVEVRLHAEHFAVPGLALLEVGDGIDDGAQSLDHRKLRRGNAGIVSSARWSIGL